ncbi:MAG TPA: hypothetical protein VH186_18645 [Chloroflexia bacterium]|nr:hypothetical protein [Chloroflexia bacterium]
MAADTQDNNTTNSFKDIYLIYPESYKIQDGKLERTPDKEPTSASGADSIWTSIGLIVAGAGIITGSFILPGQVPLVLFLLIGGSFLLWGFIQILMGTGGISKTRKLYFQGKAIPGSIKSVTRRYVSGRYSRQTYYHIKYSFTAPNGQEMIGTDTLTANILHDRPTPEEGTAVIVLFLDYETFELA